MHDDTTEMSSIGDETQVIPAVSLYGQFDYEAARVLDRLRPEQLASVLLSRIAGLDDTHPQHRETPRRFVSALRELTTPEDYNFTIFPSLNNEMITVYDIPFVSLCQHHILPFYGVAHVGYVPNVRMAGLSKLARCVKWHAASLQVQEDLTMQIAQDLETRLDPLGVAVIMDAVHTCMTIRGVQVPGAKTRTSSMLGVFADHERTAKAEFMAGINGR